jgi:class 3 adenylate cyclase/tetratricopeptide (TPR) repeat protein
MAKAAVAAASPRAETERLRPFVPRLAVEWLETTPEARVREVEGSMVFVDVSGFTKMSERLARRGKVGAEEVTDVIGDTFGTLLAEAYAFGGGLVKFGGDALLLFFEGAGHPLRATAAAHGMRATLRQIGTFTTSAGKVTLRMSVGAHSGTFHFFLVGDTHRELIVAGPAASETVAMEGAASAGQVLLSPALADALPKTNRGRALGPGFLLKGSAPEAARSEPSAVATEVDLAGLIPRALRETVSEEIEPEHRSVTIAFLHYTGFDDIVRKEGPDRAADALEELVRSTQAAVDTRDVAFLATDIAPDGGKIILTAGAPQVTGSDEEQMLLAVREIVAQEHGVPVHIGVNRGPVFAGAIGPSYRRTYTVMGDAVNLAARLMAKAEIGQILATPEVLQGSRTLFATTELEPFLVKGKKEPVQASAVGEPQGSRASIAESGLPLIGRDVELETLLEAWNGSCFGCGGLVEIAADAGMGKTRLLQELITRVGEDTVVVRGACRLYQAATPYFPFRAILRQALGLEGLDEKATAAALEALVAERAPELTPWLSLIATPLDVEIPPSKEVEQLDDRFRRSRLEESVEALLTLVLDRPVIVLVEDTHWADDASRDLLAKLAGSAKDRPWLLVATRRPAGVSLVEEDDPSSVGIELQPLTVEDAASLIDAATEDRPLMPRQVTELAERAQGNPLFLIELLDALRRGEDVDALPRSVDGLIQARIDRLAPHDRLRLRELSVLGVGFLAEHAGAVLDDARPKHVQRAIRRLGDFLSVDRKGWVQFRHALIRDAAYEGLPFRARQKLHAKVGDSILAAAGDTPEDQAELLSVHYFNAGRWDEAWTYARIAGDRARELYANVEAARFYERAVAAYGEAKGAPGSELSALWQQLGLVRERTGDYEGATLALRSAGKILQDPVAKAEVYDQRALVSYRAGKPGSALRDTALGLKLVEGHDSPHGLTTRASLLGHRAKVRLVQGRTREAIALADTAAEVAARVGARRALGTAYEVLDTCYSYLGEPEKAVYDVKALEIYRELGMLGAIGLLEMNLGVKAYARGDWDEALQRYARAQEELSRLGDHASAGFAGANLGELLVSRGLLDEAERVLSAARRALRSSRLLEGAIFADLQAARIQIARGEPELAIETASAAIDEARASGLDDLVVEGSVHLASAHLAAGDAGSALRTLDVSASSADAEDLVHLRAPLGRVRGEALLKLGRNAEAEDALREALNQARAQRLLYEEALVLAVV